MLRRELVVLVVAVSLLAPPLPADAGPASAWSCYGYTAYVASRTFQLNWSARVATAWIAPVGRQNWQQVYSAGRTPSTSFMRFDTTAFPNGLYDLLIEFYFPPNQWQTHCYGRLIEIRNAPPTPAGLTVSPSRSALDRFTFSWQPSRGAVRYLYSSQCGSSIGVANGVTGGTSVTIANALPYRGVFTFCVRAVDAAANQSAWPASIFYEWQRTTTALADVSWPSSILAGSVVTLGARLVGTGPSGEVGLAGRLLTFSYSGATSAYTDGTGLGRTAMSFYYPGTYTGRIAFTGDAQSQPASTTITFQVVRDTTPPTTPTVRVDPPSSTSNRFTASWIASSDAGGIAQYRYRIDGGAESSIGWLTTSLNGALAPGFGAHRIEVRAIDRAGNSSAWSAPARFEYVPPPSPTPVPTPPPASPTPAPTSTPDAGAPAPSQRISVDIPTR